MFVMWWSLRPVSGQSQARTELLPFISYQGVGQVMFRYRIEDIRDAVDNSIVSLHINHLHLLTVDSDESLHKTVSNKSLTEELTS